MSRKKENEFLKKALIENLANQVHKTYSSENMSQEGEEGILNHVKAAQALEAKRMHDEKNQLEVMKIILEMQQQEIDKLSSQVKDLRSEVKVLKKKDKKLNKKLMGYKDQIVDLNKEKDTCKKQIKEQKQHNKQMLQITRAIGSIMGICKMSESLNRMTDKFLDASSEMKANRRDKCLYGEKMKIIDGEYREVFK